MILVLNATFALRLNQAHFDVPTSAATPEHLAGGGLVEKKIATALLGDQEISRLIKEGKSSTP